MIDLFIAVKYNVLPLIRKCQIQLELGLKKRPYDQVYVLGLIRLAGAMNFERIKNDALLQLEFKEDIIDHDDFLLFDKGDLDLVVKSLWKVAFTPRRIITRVSLKANIA